MSTDEKSIQQFKGVPRKVGRRKELSKWRIFLSFISHKFLLSDDLLEEYAIARVSEVKADAEIKVNQAAELAARADLARAKETKAVLDLIDQAAPPEIAGDLGSELKLRKLMNDYPELDAAVRDVEKRKKRLWENYGTRVDIRRAAESTNPSANSDGDTPLALPTDESS